MPTASPLAETYFLGPATLNAVDYQTMGIDINLGPIVRHDGHSGIPYPTSAFIMGNDVEATIDFADAAPLIALGSIGAAPSNSRLVFRKGDNASGRVADATTEHIEAVIAESFERIHRSNLVGFGV